MSKPKEPLPARLVVSLIYKEASLAREGWKVLDQQWGPIDFLSEIRPFDYTPYYRKEMGHPLFRRWAAFRPLIPQDKLVEIKTQGFAFESRWQQDRKRGLNLDPGLITAERFVLATGKNYSHRIYLGKGVFADLTLVFFKGTFRPLPWSYPDYQDPRTIGMLNKIREKYLRDLPDEG